MVSPSSSSASFSSPTITSLSSPSSITSPTSTTSSSWHGLSSAANQPEAEQALDLANEAFAAGRYYKAERLCLRSIRLNETVAGNELLGRIYDKIPHARPGASSSSTSFSSSTSTPQPPPSVSSSASSSAHSSFSAFSTPSWPSWLTITPKHRRPLLVLWSLVLTVALLRYFGHLTSLDTHLTPHHQHTRTHSSAKAYTSAGTRTAGSIGGVSGGSGGSVGGSVGGWLLGLTNLFPLVLMLLFASGQWQRWLQQQQRMQQQH